MGRLAAKLEETFRDLVVNLAWGEFQNRVYNADPHARVPEARVRATVRGLANMIGDPCIRGDGRDKTAKQCCKCSSPVGNFPRYCDRCRPLYCLMCDRRNTNHPESNYCHRCR